MNIVLISCNNFYDWVATGHPNFGLGYVDLHLRGNEFLSMVQYITTGSAQDCMRVSRGPVTRDLVARALIRVDWILPRA